MNPHVAFNPSRSVPVGFYAKTDAPLTIGAFASVRALDVADEAIIQVLVGDAADRFGLDALRIPNLRFLKRVAAVRGDFVEAHGQRLWVNGEVVRLRLSKEEAIAHPHIGREIPTWSGERFLDDEVLLLSDMENEEAFDGRYWGPVSTGLIESVWVPFSPEPAQPLNSALAGSRVARM